ncbi:L-serine ammonia-lyase, iron-sulfur-dependent subunit beta [Truepera radiovictrix]|uniref:L-serine dehydratase n=1 Tax=Truepera radiovictrix (strain DSM 17093 / CIP 108686 / LMG 22925 / RQ-24) TaxID=649638 RepID=D7CV32_TRURR|nr:L-serine ammonia-lyase, iron-sulfur-dependent subunit beta [Truepera radiovictrix]ADI15859.1 L-serine dehydratase, iron-sulfur-dependent, beta subunit [Truepera radiovictrix DSM 17093]WMT58516.1 L-serine ammonia-lyase, iron-sulfur-dependent subunit beta [Truepera radiovictrix]
MGLLDVIGPVMVGPSSSHTAGACRLALLARNTLLTPPTRATLTLHGSFAKTAKGHGTDRALAAGLLGFFPDDPRIPEALTLAERAGLELEFRSRDLGDVHPNTVQLELENASERVSVLGSSVGGGLVRVVRVNGFEILFSGAYHTLLVGHTDQPGAIATVARILADDGVNIATLHCARRQRGGAAMMSLEIDRRPAQFVLDYLSQLRVVSWLRMLPEVMQTAAPTPAAPSPQEVPHDP